MEIPLYILFILYLCTVGVFLLWSFFNFYHLIKFGFFDFVGKLHGFLFITFSIIVIAITILFLKDIPWFDTFSFNALLFPNGGSFSPFNSSSGPDL